MKFKDMPYQRPDFDKEFARMKDLLRQMEEAKSEELFFEALLSLDKASGTLQTQATLASVRHTIDTRDPF